MKINIKEILNNKNSGSRWLADAVEKLKASENEQIMQSREDLSSEDANEADDGSQAELSAKQEEGISLGEEREMVQEKQEFSLESESEKSVIASEESESSEVSEADDKTISETELETTAEAESEITSEEEPETISETKPETALETESETKDEKQAETSEERESVAEEPGAVNTEVIAEEAETAAEEPEDVGTESLDEESEAEDIECVAEEPEEVAAELGAEESVAEEPESGDTETDSEDSAAGAEAESEAEDGASHDNQEGTLKRENDRNGIKEKTGSIAAALKKLKSRVKEKDYKCAGVVTAAFAVLLTVTFAYTSLIPREVNATINDKEYKVTTKQYTIEEFLEEENISYCEDDYISKPISTYIYDGISFELEHATSFKVTADGKTEEYKTLKRTVGDALKDCGIEVGASDIVTPAVNETIGDDMNIVVQRVTTEQEIVEEKIPFETKEKDDSSMNEGTSKVVTEGVDGVAKVTYEITYIDGKESSRKEIARTTVTEPVDKVIANGTKINFNGKSYSRKLVVKAYAYTGGGRTAMGTKARVGEIAVDPSVIPLGTRVYIEGVGARRAEDTGGNIKGNTIDIYMNSESQCRKWGVRYVTIYIE